MTPTTLKSRVVSTSTDKADIMNPLALYFTAGDTISQFEYRAPGSANPVSTASTGTATGQPIGRAVILINHTKGDEAWLDASGYNVCFSRIVAGSTSQVTFNLNGDRNWGEVATFTGLP